jgi:hypothetical protein
MGKMVSAGAGIFYKLELELKLQKSGPASQLLVKQVI